MNTQKNVAILIDAENVFPSHAEQIFSKAESLGTITHKEIFGAATAINMWIAPILKYVIHTNLSVRTTKGKNTSDIALAIGAMDILMQGNIDYMILVSSDSDFSTLAVRLRNSSVTVVGMGSEAVNPLWKVACSQFVTLEHTEDDKVACLESDENASDDGEAAKPNDLLEAPASTEDRRSLIFKVIQEQVLSCGGKVSAPRLFLALNDLPAYQVDKQASGFKKAQQYLVAAFSDKIHLETIDGTAWVFINESTEQQDSQEQTEEPSSQISLSDYLISEGVDADTAESVCKIFDTSKNMLQAYNQLRSEFGNTLGAEYYHKGRDFQAT